MFANSFLPRVSSRKFGILSMNLFLIVNVLAASLTKASPHSLLEQLQIHTEYVDRNNQSILDGFNLTEAQKSRIAAGVQQTDFSPPPRDSEYFKNVINYRLNSIRETLGAVVGRSEPLLHEMAAYPTCNGESNESSWQHENNITIQFSNSFLDIKYENYNLESALLRLYKINPNGTNSNNQQTPKKIEQNFRILNRQCSDPYLDSQIRVTVSIVQQMRRNKRAERKKRICNTMMMNISTTGWVEIDIKRAIHIWNEVQKQQQLNTQQQHVRSPILVGYLMIEVHDEEERPLKPGLFFKPPNCEEAEFAIPWTYYGSKSSMSSIELHEVPSYPRIDMKLIGFATFDPKNTKHLHQYLRNNLRRQLYNLSQDSAESSNEFNTSNSPINENHLETSTSRTLKSLMHSKIVRKHYQPQKEQNDGNSKEQQLEASSDIHHKKQKHHHRSHHHHNHHHLHQHHESSHDEKHHHKHNHHHETQEEGDVLGEKQSTQQGEPNLRNIHHRLIPQTAFTQNA